MRQVIPVGLKRRAFVSGVEHHGDHLVGGDRGIQQESAVDEVGLTSVDGHGRFGAATGIGVDVDLCVVLGRLNRGRRVFEAVVRAVIAGHDVILAHRQLKARSPGSRWIHFGRASHQGFRLRRPARASHRKST